MLVFRGVCFPAFLRLLFLSHRFCWSLLAVLEALFFSSAWHCLAHAAHHFPGPDSVSWNESGSAVSMHGDVVDTPQAPCIEYFPT